ncbi:riboflavin synthase [Carboxydothermus hydrogenoformans]|uniref:Riboflavin synthase n=1 Tax=Carboxydothermus hydrogenoformans (strain ATCC BAA-161 / DSM 6008 / Z-2901) TaxID=246194 RepID=Q3AC28_CARHZ|nr:riboflavin synthase [Carboxydothermus hydrogenoformans]ABB14539.1 riboflavin synthase, alpha subunit [Carboxydothermus hydrogenoformans Z-2901]
MFTGLVEELGRVREIKKSGESLTLTVEAKTILEDIKLGDSIAVNGTCLTVVNFGNDYFEADVMPETYTKTNLKFLSPGDRVNLERTLRPTDRLGGHIVQGHVDEVGWIVEIRAKEIAKIIKIKASEGFLQYLVPKGSVAVDGISLTVVDVYNDSFTVSIIPHTFKNTTLGYKTIGSPVNLEADILAKYVFSFIKKQGASRKIDLNFLAEHGFL